MCVLKLGGNHYGVLKQHSMARIYIHFNHFYCKEICNKQSGDLAYSKWVRARECFWTSLISSKLQSSCTWLALSITNFILINSALSHDKYSHTSSKYQTLHICKWVHDLGVSCHNLLGSRRNSIQMSGIPAWITMELVVCDARGSDNIKNIKSSLPSHCITMT